MNDDDEDVQIIDLDSVKYLVAAIIIIIMIAVLVSYRIGYADAVHDLIQ